MALLFRKLSDNFGNLSCTVTCQSEREIDNEHDPVVPGRTCNQWLGHRGGEGLGHPGQFPQASDEFGPGPCGSN